MNFNLMHDTKQATKDKLREKYFSLLDVHGLRSTNNILNAINVLVEEYNGVLAFDIGKYKNTAELIIAINDKDYFMWYLENVKYPRNIVYHISEKMYYTLYPEEKI